MRCAIYGRKSTEEQIASLDVQTEEATRFIQSKGWTVAPGHVYQDSAISRAEFKKRPGLIALLNALGSGEFDVVVMRDDSRLGGDMHRTGLIVQDIVEAGKRLFCYFEDNEITLDGATDKIMMALRGFAAELEREKIAGRTREHLETKARKGFVTGGKCYGYDNERVGDHVEHRINEAEAAIVREVFEAKASGDGYKIIAKRLNQRGITPPVAGKRGSGSWAPTMIFRMLRNERYTGAVLWGKHAKTYKGGTKVRLMSAVEDRIRTERAELRIVPQELWERAQAKMRVNAKPWQAGRTGPRVKHLLSGIGRCAECGGPMGAYLGRHGTESIKLYGCAYHRERGPTVCGNNVRRPVADVDAVVIDWVQSNVLNEKLIMATLAELRERIASRAELPNTERAELEKEAKKLRGEIDRLVAALASGVESTTIANVVAQREKRLNEVKARLEVLAVAPSVLDLEVRRLEKGARKRLGELRDLLETNVAEGRKVLEVLFDGPLRFTAVAPDVEASDRPERSRGERGHRFLIEGTVALHSAFSTVSVPKGMLTVLNQENLRDFRAALSA